MTYEGVPGLVERKDAYDETTLVVDPARLVEACLHLRDEEGFDFLSDITPVDYLGWGDSGVAGYFGTNSGRDLNEPASQGLARTPEPKPARFAVNYHLLALKQPPARVRLQAWLEEGEAVPSVLSVWPGADFFEREQFDLMGIVFDNHPNLERLLMPEDWEGHPLRKDYPIGGEPVRFSDEQ